MWLTTDTDVACALRVTDTQLNVTRTYSLLDAFILPKVAFNPITVDDWHKMPMPARMARINAFREYVNDLEAIDVEAIQTNDVFRPAVEAPGEPAVDWILKTGYWNDAGAWYDTAKWKN
jgi:hypothetical protein